MLTYEVLVRQTCTIVASRCRARNS